MCVCWWSVRTEEARQDFEENAREGETRCMRGVGASAMSRTRNSSRISMTRALSRSSSVSLVLPLASPQQKPTILCALRRAQSSIPAVEYCVVTSDLGNNQNKGYSQQGGEPGNGEAELDSYHSDYTSCNSSVADLFDIVDEPRRVSKEILRSVSLSFQWLDLPFHEFELPLCREEANVTNDTTYEQQLQLTGSASDNPADGKVSTGGLPTGRQGSLRFAYIHECRTGLSLVSHVELKTAMDRLQQWTMQLPRNCCLSYRHETSGEVATLPWPDLEAGGMDEIEEFVSTVNRVEGQPVFFPRYERSPFDAPKSLISLPRLSPTAMQL